jgi:alpha-1,2-mannosyltransferase
MKKLLAAVLIAYAALCATLFHVTIDHRSLWFLSAASGLFVVAVAVLARSRLPVRTVMWLVVGVGAALQVIALTHSPLTSDDANRYAWDAKVQLSGIDPYHYAPTAPQLDQLRDGTLFGPTSICTHHIAGGCTAINRPTVHTIYPPVAQGVFDVGRIVSFGGHGQLFIYQLLAALGAIAVSVLLARRALARGAPLWPVALWAWCPVVVSEFGNNAHLDWCAVLLSVLALQAGAAGRDTAAGVLVGAAIATKLYPALLLPALMRRRPWLVSLTALVAVVLVYVPHLIAVGHEVIGYLPGYLHEEGYNSGSRLLLLGAVLPHPIDTVAGGVALAATAWWVWRRSDPLAPEQSATLMTGVAILVATPLYGWYAPLLIALAVMSARYEWVVLALAPSFVYLVHGTVTHWSGAGTLIYAVAAAATALGWWLRISTTHRARTRATTRSESPYPPPESCSATPAPDHRSRMSPR